MDDRAVRVERLRETLAAIAAAPVAPPWLLEGLARLSRMAGDIRPEDLIPLAEEALARLDELAELIGEAREDAALLIDDLQARDETE
jgi:hypothetical protein